MATYYSSFFSSGLMASNHITHDCKESYTPSTPRATPISLDDQDNDTTPVAHPAGPSALPAIITSLASPTSAPERPRLRRRRSSITTSASPVSALKSTPARTATASLQRLTLYTSAPGVRSRSRAGSVTDSFVGRTSMTSNEATQANSLVGRMRSGSVGNALRSRRTLRRTTPAAPPPPTSPLPALPIPIGCPISCSPSTPRRPLTCRSQTSDNLFIPLNTLPVPRSLSPFRPTDDYSMSSSPITGPGLPSGLSVYSAGASGDFDYPSPIDTPGERRMSGYFPPFDMEMKEN